MLRNGGLSILQTRLPICKLCKLSIHRKHERISCTAFIRAEDAFDDTDSDGSSSINMSEELSRSNGLGVCLEYEHARILGKFVLSVLGLYSIASPDISFPWKTILEVFH